MANPAANLRVRISADLADIKQGLGLLRGDLAKVKQQAASALGGNQNAFVSGIRRARRELVGFIGAYVSLRGAGILSGIADEATLIRGRIREAKGDYEAILALANETRSGLNATVDLYARLERSTRQQGLNQERLLGVSKAVNQAVKLSFATAASAEAALVQLGQGLGAGALRGEELNSVMEQTPRLAQAIADGLGVPIGKLRELAKEGKLTTAAVIKALESQADVLEREFGRVPVTIRDGFTQIRNALVDYVGDQDEATGASKRFAQTLQQIGRDLPKYLDPILNAVRLLIENFDVLAVLLVTRLAGAAIATAVAGFARLVAIIRAATTVTVTLRTALLALGGPVGLVIAGLAAALYLLWKRTNDAKVAAEEHTKAMRANEQLARQSAAAAYEEAKAKRAQAIETLKAAQAILEERRARFIAEGTGRTARGGDRGDAAALASTNALVRQRATVDQARRELDDWTKRLIGLQIEIQQTEIAGADAVAAATDTATEDGKKKVKGIVDQTVLARDEIARLLKSLEDLYDRNAISIADYFAKKQALQLADIDLQIRQQEQEAKTAKSSDQQTRALTEINRLQLQRADIATQAARDQAKAEDELAKKLGEVHIRLLESEGKIGRARRAQLEEEFKDMIVRLQAEGDTAGESLVRRLINVEAAKGQLDQFESEMQRVLGSLQAAESSLSAQQQAGMLGVIEGERRIKDERAGSLEQLVALRQRAAEFLATLSADSPEAQRVLDFLRQLDGNIADVASSMQRFRQQTADAAIDAVSQLFMDLVEGSKSAGEALRDFVRGFVLSMAQIAARALATYLVLQLLDTIYPGLGKATAAGMSVGTRHTGGLVGAGGAMRSNVSPLLFGKAPRYHAGGIAGLAPDEVPTILQRGEEVLTRTDPRHRNNAGRDGGGDPIVKQPILAFGDRQFADALANSAGVEEVVVTFVENNWTRLNRGPI